MDYKTPEEARDLPGLRLALTTGLPAPWSMAARFMFDVKGIDYIPVAQLAGQDNAGLVAWTGHRNAPVAMLDDEPARTHWADILQLAERLSSQPGLVPEEPEDRIRMFGLCNEIAGAGGLTWNARHLMLAPMMESGNDAMVTRVSTMAKAYGYSGQAAAAAPAQVAGVFETLTNQLKDQAARGSRYFIGGQLSALDLLWASFSNTARPLPDDVAPMDAGMRGVYQGIGDRFQPAEALFEHRDYIYANYLALPLDY